MSHPQVLLFFQAEEKENHPAPQMTRTKQNMGNRVFVQLLSCDLKNKQQTLCNDHTFSKDSLKNKVIYVCFDLVLLHPSFVSLIHLFWKL